MTPIRTELGLSAEAAQISTSTSGTTIPSVHVATTEAASTSMSASGTSTPSTVGPPTPKGRPLIYLNTQ
jgi:hypothetical protein